METAACQLSDLKQMESLVIEIDGKEIGLIQVKNEIYAFENTCPHKEGPVCFGEVKGRPKLKLDDMKRVCGEYESEDEIHLICPWHGIEFDVNTGKNLVENNLKLKKFATSVRNEQVYVDIK